MECKMLIENFKDLLRFKMLKEIYETKFTTNFIIHDSFYRS